MYRFGRLAQLIRASRLHREGQGFESLNAHQKLEPVLYRFNLWIVMLYFLPRPAGPLPHRGRITPPRGRKYQKTALK